MSECKRCGKLNPAEIHTCTPSVEYLHQRLALKDLEIMRLREAAKNYILEGESCLAELDKALSTPTTYDDLMAWHDEQLGEPVAWISEDENFIEFRRDALTELSYKKHEIFPLYAKKG